MRRPSRFMPKREQVDQAGLGVYCIVLVLALLPAIFILSKDQSKFAVGFLAFLYIGLFIIGCIVGFINSVHFKKLSLGREDESICTFARFFDCRVVDTWIIRAVYEEIQEMLGTNLPIRPQDDIFKDLQMDPDDFELNFKTDLVGIIAQRTGRSMENIECNPYFGKANTVEGLVLFFNNQPRTVSFFQ